MAPVSGVEPLRSAFVARSPKSLGPRALSESGIAQHLLRCGALGGGIAPLFNNLVRDDVTSRRTGVLHRSVPGPKPLRHAPPSKHLPEAVEEVPPLWLHVCLRDVDFLHRQEKPGAIDELQHMIFVNLNASQKLRLVLRLPMLDLLDDPIAGIDVELIAKMTALTQTVGRHELCAHPELPVLAHEDLLRRNKILIKVLKEVAVGGGV